MENLYTFFHSQFVWNFRTYFNGHSNIRIYKYFEQLYANIRQQHGKGTLPMADQAGNLSELKNLAIPVQGRGQLVSFRHGGFCYSEHFINFGLYTQTNFSFCTLWQYTMLFCTDNDSGLFQNVPSSMVSLLSQKHLISSIQKILIN